MRVDFQLTGMTPLLLHQDDVIQADALGEWRSDPNHKELSKRGDDRSPPWTWKTYTYTDGQYVVMPSANLMVCLRQAGVQLLHPKGKSGKTLKEATQSGLQIDAEFLALLAEGKRVPWAAIAAIDSARFLDHVHAAEALGFRLFVKRAKVGQAKHIRVRPRFNDWAVHGTLCVLDDVFSRDLLRDLFEKAGKQGLGDWRPGCKTPGSFGQFTAKLSFK